MTLPNDELHELRRQFAFNSWANRETAAALSRTHPVPFAAQRALAHVIGAEWLWLARLQDEPARAAVWPDMEPAACAEEILELDTSWMLYLDLMSRAGLQEAVAYVNSRGESFQSSVHDILTHVLLHSSYHRGQIAFEMRREGFEPACTDFIHAVRQGLIR